MKNKILVAVLVVLFASCNQTKKSEYQVARTQILTKDYQLVNEGYELMKTNCYACHNPNSASHDDILAPPFKAVKMHYKRAYNDRADFINAMVNWVQNPNEDKALMQGAVNKFKVMPKLPLPTKDLEKIAAYLYDNEVEEPVWMSDHMKEMQGNGMGKGIENGMGKGKMNKN
ncbi:MAG: c-type cytochrome [Bacteroidota bacterium]